MRNLSGFLVILGLLAVPAPAVSAAGATTERAFDAQVAAWRTEGRTALDRLLAQLGRPGVDQAELKRKIDAVARQKDAHASGLYWLTDLAAAQAAAREERKPILSLRLLGNLDEAHSCANSRLFRTVLYADARVSRYLRDHYVLHWQSVRPAPRVTIDFGDGRVLKTTLTGNSLHYVLDASGRPIDALPGLYGPGRFLAELKRAEGTVHALAATTGKAWQQRLEHHLAERGATAPAARPPRARPGAIEASRLTVSKAVVELPVLRSLQPRELPVAAAPLPPVAPANTKSARLDSGSLRLMREHLGDVPDFEGRVAALEGAIAQDEALNERRLRPAVLGLIRNYAPAIGLETLTDRIYGEVFRTPSSDPFLGLESADLYNGLPRNGLVTP